VVSSAAYNKKLIEVALPLDEINAACKADKDRKTGTIRNLHKWFAPMPLPAWRALIFAALIDDPEDDNFRVYLLDVIKRLVKNGADLPDQEDLNEARGLLQKQYGDDLPSVMDPFCGAGSTLIEGQRLGLKTFGSDLNPVPVLISKTLTELLPAMAGAPPLHSSSWEGEGKGQSKGEGLFAASQENASLGYLGVAKDVLYYADKVRARVLVKVQQLFPVVGGETAIAWIWTRTAPCPNPACGATAVLSTSWWLSKQKGAMAWIEPDISGNRIDFRVRANMQTGSAPAPPKQGRGAAFLCLACDQLISEEEIKKYGLSGQLGFRMVAVVAETATGRVYRSPRPEEIEAAASVIAPDDLPEISLGPPNQYVAPPRYGLTTFLDLYTPRQLTVMAAFADAVSDIYVDAQTDGASVERATVVTTVLGLALGKLAQYCSSQAMIVPYPTSTTRFNSGFARNDLPMTWDFYEGNVFGNVGGTWSQLVKTAVAALSYAPSGVGRVVRADARQAKSVQPALVATDPPYFDAIGYADLSDYFYLWHRRALRRVHPELYATVAAPKAGELTAFSWHHGGTKEAARDYFIEGFTETFKNLQESLGDGLPMLVVYASKEQKAGGEEETRWSSILTAIINADLEITGTWPIHGTGSTRMRGIGSNVMATYIVMVCRPKPENAGTTSLADFTRALRRELAPKVRDLQAASILPVDLAQAAMGPGMAIYSRYRCVLEQGGGQVGVEQALRLINAALREVLDEQQGDIDPESQFATRWWETYGWGAAEFGQADKAARPLGISVDDVKRAQVATSVGNKIQLVGSRDLDRSWTPAQDRSPTAWEAVHHLIDRLIDGGGELEAARLMGALGSLQDPAMALVYRLHDIAAQKGRTADQERYNALISSWTQLIRLSGDGGIASEGLF
jgi:putative DNA methylase